MRFNQLKKDGNTKLHYRMYKVGKNMVNGMIATFGALAIASAIGIGNVKANADTTGPTDQSSAKSELVQSSNADKTSTDSIKDAQTVDQIATANTQAKSNVNNSTQIINNTQSNENTSAAETKVDNLASSDNKKNESTSIDNSTSNDINKNETTLVDNSTANGVNSNEATNPSESTEPNADQIAGATDGKHDGETNTTNDDMYGKSDDYKSAYNTANTNSKIAYNNGKTMGQFDYYNKNIKNTSKPDQSIGDLIAFNNGYNNGYDNGKTTYDNDFSLGQQKGTEDGEININNLSPITLYSGFVPSSYFMYEGYTSANISSRLDYVKGQRAAELDNKNNNKKNTTRADSGVKDLVAFQNGYESVFNDSNSQYHRDFLLGSNEIEPMDADLAGELINQDNQPKDKSKAYQDGHRAKLIENVKSIPNTVKEMDKGMEDGLSDRLSENPHRNNENESEVYQKGYDYTFDNQEIISQEQLDTAKMEDLEFNSDFYYGYKSGSSENIIDVTIKMFKYFKQLTNGITDENKGMKFVSILGYTMGDIDGYQLYQNDKVYGMVDGQADALAGKEHANNFSQSKGYQDGYNETYFKSTETTKTDYLKGLRSAEQDTIKNNPKDTTQPDSTVTDLKSFEAGYNALYNDPTSTYYNDFVAGKNAGQNINLSNLFETVDNSSKSKAYQAGYNETHNVTIKNAFDQGIAGEQAAISDRQANKEKRDVSNEPVAYQRSYNSTYDQTDLISNPEIIKAFNENTSGYQAGYVDGLDGNYQLPDDSEQALNNDRQSAYNIGYNFGIAQYEDDKVIGLVDGQTDGLAGKSQADLSIQSAGYQAGYNQNYAGAKVIYDADYQKGVDEYSNGSKIDLNNLPLDIKDRFAFIKGYEQGFND